MTEIATFNVLEYEHFPFPLAGCEGGLNVYSIKLSLECIIAAGFSLDQIVFTPEGFAVYGDINI
jgi:hypothetical protein